MKNELAAQFIQNISKSITKKKLEDQYYNILGLEKPDDHPEKYIKFINHDSTIVKDVKIEYGFMLHNASIKTNMGESLSVSNNLINSILKISQEFVSDIYIDIPQTSHTTRIYKNIDIVNASSHDLEIKSPWLYYKRSSAYLNHQLTIKDKIIIYKSYITNQEIKSQAFIDLQTSLEKNALVAIVFKRVKSNSLLDRVCFFYHTKQANISNYLNPQ